MHENYLMLKIRFLSGEKTVFKAATFGCFDGLHLGHQDLIKKLTEPACLIKLVPNPKVVFKKIFSGKKILTLRLFLDYLKNFPGLAVALLRFDKRVRSLKAEDFLRYLSNELGRTEIILGEDAKLGIDQKSVLELLENPILSVKKVELRFFNREKISSTHLRNLILMGDLESFFCLTGRFIELDVRQFNHQLSCLNLHPLAGSYIAVSEGSKFKMRFENETVVIEPPWSQKRRIFRLLKRVG